MKSNTLRRIRWPEWLSSLWRCRCALALTSGLPPFVGLLTGIIGGLLVTALSPSRFAVSGPAAGLVTIVVASVDALGSFSAFLFALVLAGVLQLAMGLLRAGRFIALVPGSVIKGMLAAIGLLLIMQQIPVAFGAVEESSLRALFSGEFAFSLTSFAVAAGGIIAVVVLGFPAHQAVEKPELDPPVRWLRWFSGARFHCRLSPRHRICYLRCRV